MKGSVKVPVVTGHLSDDTAYNQSLQKHYESPISIAYKEGAAGIKRLHEKDPTLIIRWLSLIYFKTHYNDLFIRAYRNPNEGSSMIGDRYDWGVMNMPHALFRSPLYGTSLKNLNIGSLCVMQIKNPYWAGLFDYRDDFLSGTVYLRIGDVAFIGVLNDAGLTNAIMRGRFDLPQGAFVAQALEVLTDYQVFNNSLRTKPDYFKGWNKQTGLTYIRTELPNTLVVDPIDCMKRHKHFWSHLEQYAELKMDGGIPLADIKSRLLNGDNSLALCPPPKSFPTEQELLKQVKTSADSASFYISDSLSQ